MSESKSEYAEWTRERKVFGKKKKRTNTPFPQKRKKKRRRKEKERKTKKKSEKKWGNRPKITQKVRGGGGGRMRVVITRNAELDGSCRDQFNSVQFNISIHPMKGNSIQV